MILKNKKVAIIGAGPVGLTMAALLQQKGVEVSVYERDKNAGTRISGGPLDLHIGSGQDAMKEAGLLDHYFAMALPMGRTVADKDGKVFFSKKPTVEEQYDNPEINRNDLRKILLDSLTSGTVVWDMKFTELEERDGRWLLHFEKDRTGAADFVIGANGGMSKARKYVTDAEIEYTGTLIIQGEVLQPEVTCPEFYKLCDDNILMASGEGNLFTANPKNGNSLGYAVTFKKPAGWEDEDLNFQDNENITAFLLKRFSGWDERYKEVFRATASFVLWPTRKISLDKPWKTSRSLPVTLIGDAAHIMPPFAGQGVNTGLKDALILAGNLTNGKFESIEAAISAYEQEMFVYAKEAQSETAKNEIEMRQPGFSFGKRFSK